MSWLFETWTPSFPNLIYLGGINEFLPVAIRVATLPIERVSSPFGKPAPDSLILPLATPAVAWVVSAATMTPKSLSALGGTLGVPGVDSLPVVVHSV